MTFEYKGQPYRLPNGLHEITLASWQQYAALYGLDLDEREAAIAYLDDYERETEKTILDMDRLCTLFSFFSGISLEETRGNIAAGDMLGLASLFDRILRQQEAELQAPMAYTWKGEEWVIVTPPGNEDEITATQYLQLMQVLRLLEALGAGDWSSFHRLAALYLKRPGESWNAVPWDAESDRAQLMLQLPLDIAFGLSLYLNSTLEIFISLMAGQTVDQAQTDNDGSKD